jgi:DNA-directed RNA polymerase specialized sigma24 family protein
MIYDLGDGTYTPPGETAKEESREDKPKKNRVIKKKRKEKTPLDLVVEEIIENKKNKDYTFKELTDEDFLEWEKGKKEEWENGTAEADSFDNDYYLYILANAVMFIFDYEQGQKQIYYGVTTRKSGNMEIHSISYDTFMSVSDRISDGYFTAEEKERIARELHPLEQSVYRKYVPGDNAAVGPYTKEDIRDALYLGITKALNSYGCLSEKMKVSFSSWVYICMNNACIDAIRPYVSGKYKGITNVSIYGSEDDRGVNWSEDNSANMEVKRIEAVLSVNQNNEQMDSLTDNMARSEFLESVFSEMEKQGKKKIVRQQIIILKSYFGLTSGNPMEFFDISRMLNMDIDKVKKLFESGKVLLANTVYKMGYSNDEVLALFCR